MNTIDVLLVIGIAVVVAFAVYLMIKRSRRGGCSGDCGRCSGCH